MAEPSKLQIVADFALLPVNICLGSKTPVDWGRKRVIIATDSCFSVPENQAISHPPGDGLPHPKPRFDGQNFV
jgi:hypothetical protein